MILGILYFWCTGLSLLTSAHVLDERQTETDANTHVDYVILGGGTAGLVLASRLSEDSTITVAVIEAGDFERTNPNVTSTTGLGLAKNTRVDWQYDTAPQIFAANETIIYSAGKGVGGSSLINGMWYCLKMTSRGHTLTLGLRHDIHARC